jgi:hypothetical protein
LTTYLDLIDAFDAGLRGAGLPPGLTARNPEETERRFAVYRNNVAVSLTEALASRFPVIQRLVGAEFFAAMARIYAERHRPETPVLLEWGGSLPGFLAGFEPLADYPYMPDVARLEYARGLAFHAADAPPANPARLAGADPSGLVLRLHPSVQVLRLNHPAVSIWHQNQPGTAPQGLTLAGPEIALVLRDPSFNVPVSTITPAEAVMIDHIRQGATLTTAAEMALWADMAFDPQPLILRLIRSGALLDPKEGEPC